MDWREATVKVLIARSPSPGADLASTPGDIAQSTAAKISEASA